MSTPINYPENNDNNDQYNNRKDNNTIRKNNDTPSKISANEKIESLFSDGSKQSQNDTDISKENYPKENTQSNVDESQRESNMYGENNRDIPGLGAGYNTQDYTTHTYNNYVKDHPSAQDQDVYYNSQNFNHYSNAHSPYPQQQLYPQKPLNSKGKATNWPDFLIEDGNQKLYGLGSLIAGFATSGILGIAMAIYYLFILDDAVQKDTVAKTMNWISLIIPIVFYILIFLGFFLFMIMGFVVQFI